MKTCILSFLIIISLGTTAQAQTTKKIFELPEFKGIYVNSNYTVYLKQTNKQEVTVEALTEIYTISDIRVENGILLVNIDRKPESPNKSIWAKIDDIKLNPVIKLYVSVKNINELQVNGGGKIISENSIGSDIISLGVSGNGSIDLDIKGNIVKSEISGAGNIALKGYATSLDFAGSGTGNLHAFNCPVEQAKIKVSGPGNAELNVSNSLEALVLG